LAEFLKSHGLRIGHEIHVLYMPRGSRFVFANFTNTKNAQRAAGKLIKIGLRIKVLPQTEKHYYKKPTRYRGCADD